jgi:hypothetical protein
LLPDHAPEAEQEVAFVEDQVSIEDPLLVTDAGLAASDTIGDGGRGTSPVQFAGSDPAPPQAAIARASRGTSSDASVRSDVCFRKIRFRFRRTTQRLSVTIRIRMIYAEQQTTKRRTRRFAELLACSWKIIFGRRQSVGDWRHSEKCRWVGKSRRDARDLLPTYTSG